MKAERRHELKENSLAKGLGNLPVLISIHLNKILLGLIFVCLLVLLIQYRINSSKQAHAQAMASMTDIRTGVLQAQQLSFGVGIPEEIAAGRNRILNDTDSLINTVLNDTSDPADAAVRAEALVARGDLFWHLANSAVLPGSTTREALLLPRKASELMDRAKVSYEAVVSAYPDEVLSHASALIGLAVIAETNGDHLAALKHYQAIIDNAKLAATFGPTAKARIVNLENLKGKVLLAAYGEAAVPVVPTPLMTPAATTEPSPFGSSLGLPSFMPTMNAGASPSTTAPTTPPMTPSTTAPTTPPATPSALAPTTPPAMTVPVVVPTTLPSTTTLPAAP